MESMLYWKTIHYQKRSFSVFYEILIYQIAKTDDRVTSLKTSILSVFELITHINAKIAWKVPSMGKGKNIKRNMYKECFRAS